MPQHRGAGRDLEQLGLLLGGDVGGDGVLAPGRQQPAGARASYRLAGSAASQEAGDRIQR